jgi:hypothetical protein
VLGAILISGQKTSVSSALTHDGVPRAIAAKATNSFGASAGPSGRASPSVVHDVQLTFAHSTQTVFYIMAAVMAVTFVVAVRGLPRGRVETADQPVAAVAQP